MSVSEQSTGVNRWQRTSTELRELIAKVKDEYPLLGVLGAAGVKTRSQGRDYVVAKCPFPNHEDANPSFKVKLSAPERFYCFGCSASGDVFDFIHYYYGKTSLDEQVRFLTGKGLGELARGLSSHELQQAVAERDRRRKELQESRRGEGNEQECVDDKTAGRVYEAMLDCLELSPHHRNQLNKRGVMFEEAIDLGYRSLPIDRDTRIGLCEELLSDGYNLCGVPGFFRLPQETGGDTGRWCVGGTSLGWREIHEKRSGRMWRTEGLLIPTCDELGRVIRLKLRNDPPPDNAPDWVVETWPAKYMALSSKGRSGGAGAGIHLHHVGPRDGGDFSGVLWVTEGEVKADIASIMLTARVVGVPGVGQCAEQVIEAMRRGGHRKLFVAMDSEMKGHIHLAVARLCCLATNAGGEPFVVIWDASLGKGIDDLLIGGGIWKAISYEKWWGRFSEEERESIEYRLAGVCVA